MTGCRHAAAATRKAPASAIAGYDRHRGIAQGGGPGSAPAVRWNRVARPLRVPPMESPTVEVLAFPAFRTIILAGLPMGGGDRTVGGRQ